MPRRQPFTALCQTLARPPRAGRADLHTHSTCSDGAYSPAQLVDLACRSGLSALALTDHDTLAGIEPARAAAGTALEIVPGVEISAALNGRGIHLLGYFFRSDDPALNAALDRLHRERAARFRAMAERLRGAGVSLDEGEVRAAAGAAVPGRRLLAELVVRAGRAATVREAFRRYLSDRGPAALPSPALPAAAAIALVRAAGGVAALAHPSYDEGTRPILLELRSLGLGAVEVDYPGLHASKRRRLRALAVELGLAVSGGSDCHGPDVVHRAVGSGGVTAAEFNALRQRASFEVSDGFSRHLQQDQAGTGQDAQPLQRRGPAVPPEGPR
ncbi:MAG: PHP domain-containing protein [Gemmataceae bacterium]|nr:PHP domain-containing protein [Gemmataceae bacterium]